ncbi:MAG TPA: bifunctional diaminohydroxyphosphoribosylaminopyrimidine deaminase/5-amino-6-(5-phosphoribosylamino)uracil reductase RibD [Candidatus Binatia bacterium]|nr:bifunctional diaminohydroxyphosphoribosylaminopyrimidine deaminase/5-amino-6-(5-phosphoribosylamino)uracil reductase RibD [Candidatus Binatia bacterium]
MSGRSRAAATVADARHMRRALALAQRGLGRTSPNPPVGAVVVKDGRVVGEGWHRRAGTDHAEVVALAAAGERARGATLYCTLEPCSHHGRTPPCAPRVAAAGIRRAVVATADPNPRVRGRGLAALRRAGIAVATGVEERAARELIAAFAHHVRTGKPLVRLKLAASADGRIATRSGRSRWITGPPARALVHRWRDEHDAVLVGVGTVLADDPQLTCRRRGGRDPVRIVVDSRLRTPSAARLLDGTGGPVWVATTSRAGAAARARLARRGATVLVVPGRGDRVDLGALFRMLGRRDIVSVLAEGGGDVAAALLAGGHVDELRCFTAPLLVGGDGIPMVGSLGIDEMDRALRLSDVRVQAVGRDWLWIARPARPSGRARAAAPRPRPSGRRAR